MTCFRSLSKFSVPLSPHTSSQLSPPSTPLQRSHHESESDSTSTHLCHNATAYSIDDLTSTPPFRGAVRSLQPAANPAMNMDVVAASSSSRSNGEAAGSRPPAKPSSTKRLSKGDAAKPKPLPNLTGSRFQCPKCPKTFSRIENLTRHQANRKYWFAVDIAGIGEGIPKCQEDG